jgi:hypothetical protein
VRENRFPSGKRFCSAGKSFPERETVLQCGKIVSRAGNGFAVRENHFPNGKRFSIAGKSFPERETVLQCGKIISRTGKGFSSAGKSFPALEMVFADRTG